MVRLIPARQSAVRASPLSSLPFELMVANPRVPATTTIKGCASAIFFSEAVLQIAQFFMTLLLEGFHAGMSAGEHADIVNDKSFHPFFLARLFMAGNQERA